MFGSIGMPELILIFVVALLVFGPKKLPELGKSLGKGLAEFKKASEDLKKTIEDEIEQGKQEAAAVKQAGRRGPHDHRDRRRLSGRRPVRRRAGGSGAPRTEPADSDPPGLSAFNPRDLLEGKVGRPARAADEDELPRMGFFEHLEELRKRLIVSIITVFVTFLACWAWAPEIFEFLARPIRGVLPPGQDLAYTTLTEPFLMYFRVALLAGTLLASPILLWQVWLFISPALYRREKRGSCRSWVSASLFFLVGLRLRVLRGLPARGGLSHRRREALPGRHHDQRVRLHGAPS